MKNIKTIGKGLAACAAAAVFLLALAGCTNMFGTFDGNHSDKEGLFSLKIAGEGRTIMPAAMASEYYYTLRFTPATGSPVTFDKNHGDISAPVKLPAGTYDLTVTAYSDSGRTKEAAKGELKNITVSPAQAASGTVNLVPNIEAGGTGTFSWKIKYPAGAAGGLKIAPYAGAPGIDPVTPENGWIIFDAAKNENSGSEALGTGYYKVFFSLTDAQERRMARTEYLHVYNNMDSRFEFEFLEKHFIEANTSTATAFTISGTFADAGQGIDAKFIASQIADSPLPSPSTRSAARSVTPLQAVPEEIALEGLLEDGDITFRLKGSYNSSTKLYVLSAAASFMRYSIAGDISDSESSKAVIQYKAGNNWTSIELDVEAVSSEPGEEIDVAVNEPEDPGTIEEELGSGIPEEMWGVWWGLETFERGKGDIVQSGSYYYAIDAFTIVEYVDRYGKWNREGYTCFFEGADVDAAGVVSGRVIFDYTDQKLIDEKHPTWWINCIADYAKTAAGGGQAVYERIIAVLDDAKQGWQLWSDPSWTALLNEWSAKSEHAGFTSKRWGELFAQPDSEYFYQAYKKDSFRITGGLLQMGTCYKAADSGVYFDKDADKVQDFNDLRWSANKYSKDKTTADAALPTSEKVTGKWGALSVPDEITAVKHNSFEGKEDVLQVTSGFHWSVVDYDLAQFKGGQEVIFDVSMDIWLKTEARVAWQINQGSYMEQQGYPLIAGAFEVYEAGKWHSISTSTTPEALANVLVGSDKKLYLSTMQILITSNDPNAPTTLVENDIYIANVSISAVGGSTTEIAPPAGITGNLGNYTFGTDTTNPNYIQAAWPLSGEELGMAQANDAQLVFEFTYPLSDLDIVWGAQVNGWWGASTIISNGVPAMSGVTYTGNTLTISLPDTLNNFNLFKHATYANLIIVDWMAVNINGLGMTSANLTGTYVPIEPTPGEYNLGAYTWDASDSAKGWMLISDIREKIADGSIKYFVIGLNAASVQAAGGLGGIKIIFNAASGWNEDGNAFPWYYEAGKDFWNGWIPYDDLIGDAPEGYGADVVDGVVYLQYDLTSHPGYSAFKTALPSATWAQFGLYVFEEWKDGKTWHPVSTAFFKEDQ